MKHSVCSDCLQINSLFILNVTFNVFIFTHLPFGENNMIKLFTRTAEAHSLNFTVSMQSFKPESLMNRLFACFPVDLSQP